MRAPEAASSKPDAGETEVPVVHLPQFAFGPLRVRRPLAGVADDLVVDVQPARTQDGAARQLHVGRRRVVGVGHAAVGPLGDHELLGHAVLVPVRDDDAVGRAGLLDAVLAHESPLHRRHVGIHGPRAAGAAVAGVGEVGGRLVGEIDVVVVPGAVGGAAVQLHPAEVVAELLGEPLETVARQGAVLDPAARHGGQAGRDGAAVDAHLVGATAAARIGAAPVRRTRDAGAVELLVLRIEAAGVRLIDLVDAGHVGAGRQVVHEPHGRLGVRIDVPAAVVLLDEARRGRIVGGVAVPARRVRRQVAVDGVQPQVETRALGVGVLPGDGDRGRRIAAPAHHRAMVEPHALVHRLDLQNLELLGRPGDWIVRRRPIVDEHPVRAVLVRTVAGVSHPHRDVQGRILDQRVPREVCGRHDVGLPDLPQGIIPIRADVPCPVVIEVAVPVHVPRHGVGAAGCVADIRLQGGVRPLVDRMRDVWVLLRIRNRNDDLVLGESGHGKEATEDPQEKWRTPDKSAQHDVAPANASRPTRRVGAARALPRPGPVQLAHGHPPPENPHDSVANNNSAYMPAAIVHPRPGPQILPPGRPVRRRSMWSDLGIRRCGSSRVGWRPTLSRIVGPVRLLLRRAATRRPAADVRRALRQAELPGRMGSGPPGASLPGQSEGGARSVQSATGRLRPLMSGARLLPLSGPATT